jgi:hypothetical protein
VPLVQQAFAQIPAGVTAQHVTLPAVITAGNVVIFVATARSPEGTTSDSTWEWEDGTPIDVQVGMWEGGASLGGSASGLCSAFYSTFSSSGLRTIEVTTGTESVAFVVFEWTGMVSSPLDETIQPPATGTGTSAASGSTATLATTSSLLVAASTQYSGSSVAVTLPASHTSLAALADASISPPLFVTYREITSTSAQSATFTYASSVQWITGLSAFTLDPTWSPPPPPYYPVSRGGGSG